MGWLARWRLNSAARAYARRLPVRLMARWGVSTTYSKGQLDTCIRALRLNPKHSYIAYAVYLPGEERDALVAMPEAEAARAAFKRWMPLMTSWGPPYEGGTPTSGD